LFAPAGACFGDEPGGYEAELIGQARADGLHEDRYWDILLHYKPLGQGKESLIDDPAFFLSEEGKHSPGKELESTIHGFFRSTPLDDDHPRCKFPARFLWLKERLNMDESALPNPSCERLGEAIRSMDPESAVLVFPAPYMNNESSLFGHTFIRIDRHGRNDLLSFTVSYAAVTPERGGLGYALKGLTGGFRGYYSYGPYYEKIREYNDIESRDLWEYHLDFTEPEVMRMVLHVLELKDIYAEYFFFDENCSFNLLFLLEAGRPSLRLTEAYWTDVSFWVLPSDVIRLLEANGVIRHIAYRPALATRLRSRIHTSEPRIADAAVGIVRQGVRPHDILLADELSPEEKSRILDLSGDMVQYRFSRLELTQEEYQEQYLSVARARKELTVEPAPREIPEPPSPEKGHRPGRVSVGAGFEDDSFYTNLQLRVLYHDLKDFDGGFVKGYQVNLVDSELRYNTDTEEMDLQRLLLVDMVSLMPRDTFFRTLSWKLKTGLERRHLTDEKDRLIYRLNFGTGVSYTTILEGIMYGFVEADITAGDYVDRWYAAGLGVSGGWVLQVEDFWRIHISGSALYYEVGEEHREYRASVFQNFKLNDKNSLGLSVSYESTFDADIPDVNLSWMYYY
jgi:hypothetical protein